jgi:hypothetical protein
MSVDLETVGQSVGRIPVYFSYNIIELFSGHLYSSPIKAIEELVANSYDAFATQCIVSVPEKKEGQFVWVWDNGDSMDLDGLKDLWLVAETNKRIKKAEGQAEKRGRLPIGKFGIGKLASYVLGKRITHICKKNSQYLAVTMNYDVICKSTPSTPYQEVNLSARKLSEKEILGVAPSVAKSLLDNYGIDITEKKCDHWTLVVVDALKQRLDLGRLGWVLSTALPLRPDFKLVLNEKEVQSSKTKIPKIKEWQIGKDDSVAEKLGYETGEDKDKPEPYNYFEIIPNYGKVSGTVEIFKDSLDAGKAIKMGHSNGFFIMVRGRLINENDNLFGITGLPFLGFNRIRVVMHADFLDKFLTANREDISDAGAKAAIQTHLRALYNDSRSIIEKEFEQEAKKETLEDHLKNLPGTLLSYPLRQAMEKISSDQYTGYSITAEVGKKPIATIEKIEIKETSVEGPLATLNEGKIYINANHPFYRDYADYPGVRKLMVAEVLLEAYMVDAGVNSQQTREVLTRRDQLLRTLASKFPEDALAVSQSIRSAVTSQEGLEIACVDGFRVLGYEATHIGGKGKPDGIAVAPLGMQDTGSRSYSVSIDAKSTLEEGVTSGNIGFSTLARHRDEFKADHAVVIAPDYQVSEGEESKAVKEARRENVCLIRAKDFADLVIGSAAKPISLEKLRELLRLQSPEETTKWIKKFNSESFNPPPIVMVLNTVWKIQQEDTRDAPEIGAIRYKETKLKDYSKDEIRSLLNSIQRLVPELVIVLGDKVQLNQSPKNVISQCISVLQKLPSDIMTKPMLDALASENK